MDFLSKGKAGDFSGSSLPSISFDSSKDLNSVWISFDPHPFFGASPKWSSKLEYEKDGMKMERKFESDSLQGIVQKMEAFHKSAFSMTKTSS